jgi:uncharacterized protein
MVGRLVATAEAMELLRRLRGLHGGLMMHQSGGCCDGSSPMCFPEGEFIVGDRDVLLGVIDDVPVWISGSQFETWKHTQLVLDVVPGRGGGFSLESPEGVRFLSRGRVFTPEENDELAATVPLTGADWERGDRPAPGTEALIVQDVIDACSIPTKPL